MPPRKPSATVAQRIRELRDAHKLSRAFAAHSLEPSAGESTWKNWETGASAPSAEYILALSDFFNVSPGYLLGREDAPWPTGRSDDSRRELVDPSSAASEAAARGGARRAGRPRPAAPRGSRRPRPGS